MKLESFLSVLQGVKDTGNGQYIAKCPAHDDSKPSMSVSEKDNKILLCCHCGCSPEAITEALGLAVRDLFISEDITPSAAKTRSHEYRDELNGTIARKDVITRSDGSKSCVWYRWEDGKYIKGLNGFKPLLYHLPELISSTGQVFITEGEKDTETIERLGYTATTSPNGAGAKWNRKKNNKYFVGRDVIILADNDEAGENYAKNVAEGVSLTAQSVKIIPSAVIWPQLSRKGDISDVAAALGDIEAKQRLTSAIEATDFCYKKPEPTAGVQLPDYFYSDSNDTVKVNSALLAKAFREREHYLMVKSPMSEKATVYLYSKGRYIGISDNHLRGFIKKYITDYYECALKMRDVDEVFKNLTTDLAFYDPCELNSNENIINFKNGLLKLDTMELAAHTPDEKSTIQIPCNWNPNGADTPVFNRFMESLAGGDNQVKELLLQFIGACISNVKGYRFKKALILVGIGNTGKTQIKRLIERILGDENCCAVDLSEIEKRFGMANLYDKRLAGSNDMSFMKIDQLKKLKLLTGGDPVDFERKGKDKFTAVFNGLLWFCTNELPLFGGDRGQWVYDRFAIIKCSNVIPPSERDRYICDKMFAEREGIVCLAVRALKRAAGSGYTFSIPESSKALLTEYAENNSPTISFFKECCILRVNGNPRDSCTCKTMYDVFKAWCAENCNGYTPKKSEFIKELAEYLKLTPERLTYRTNSDRFYIFTLSIEAKQEYRRAYGYDSASYA